jgi:hypothetical protein
MWLQLCINLTLGLLQTKHLTNGDQWEEGHAVIETYVFNRICMFATDYRRTLCRSTAFSWVSDITKHMWVVASCKWSSSETTIIKKWKAKYLEGLQRAHSKKRKWRAEGAGFFIVTSSAAVSYCAFNLTLYLPCIFKWDMFNNHQLMHINFFTIVYS